MVTQLYFSSNTDHTTEQEAWRYWGAGKVSIAVSQLLLCIFMSEVCLSPTLIISAKQLVLFKLASRQHCSESRISPRSGNRKLARAVTCQMSVGERTVAP